MITTLAPSHGPTVHDSPAVSSAPTLAEKIDALVTLIADLLQAGPCPAAGMAVIESLQSLQTLADAMELTHQDVADLIELGEVLMRQEPPQPLPTVKTLVRGELEQILRRRK